MRACKKVAYATRDAAIIDIKKNYEKGNDSYPQSYYQCPVCKLFHLTTQQNVDNEILKMMVGKIVELETKIQNQKIQINQLIKNGQKYTD